VLVSEVMLQQTPVRRVVPAWQAFLDRFPTPAAAAAAPVAELIEQWSGLGYNRRAVALHGAATAVVTRHGGRVPDDLDALLALPGVGPYTARAVLAFAYGADVGVLDTNVARVLARAVAGRRLGLAEARRLADQVVLPGRGWEWNQAMIDLGAAVCVSRRPRCEVCPFASACAWHRLGRPEPDPAVGTAGRSGRQGRFAGSDREGRGRLVAALRRGRLGATEVAAAAGWPDEPARAERVAAELVEEGLAAWDDAGGLGLPGGHGYAPPGRKGEP
jgi:A/G-specific adenine glycosylase